MALKPTSVALVSLMHAASARTDAASPARKAAWCAFQLSVEKPEQGKGGRGGAELDSRSALERATHGLRAHRRTAAAPECPPTLLLSSAALTSQLQVERQQLIAARLGRGRWRGSGGRGGCRRWRGGHRDGRQGAVEARGRRPWGNAQHLEHHREVWRVEMRRQRAWAVGGTPPPGAAAPTQPGQR